MQAASKPGHARGRIVTGLRKSIVGMDGVIAGMIIAAVMLMASQALTGAEPPGADVTALRGLKLPPVEKKPWVFEGFPIMAWWPPPGTKTLEDFRRYKDAGFTIYVANPDVGFGNALKVAREAGLPVMPHRAMGDFDLPAPEKPVVFPSNDPNVVGWCTRDEPGWVKPAIEATTEVNELMRSDPSRWALFNNLPLHRPQKLPVLEIAEAALRNGMPVLGYDNYVIDEDGTDKAREHFDNLANFR